MSERPANGTPQSFSILPKPWCRTYMARGSQNLWRVSLLSTTTCAPPSIGALPTGQSNLQSSSVRISGYFGFCKGNGQKGEPGCAAPWLCAEGPHPYRTQKRRLVLSTWRAFKVTCKKPKNSLRAASRNCASSTRGPGPPGRFRCNERHCHSLSYPETSHRLLMRSAICLSRWSSLVTSTPHSLMRKRVLPGNRLTGKTGPQQVDLSCSRTSCWLKVSTGALRPCSPTR